MPSPPDPSRRTGRRRPPLDGRRAAAVLLTLGLVGLAGLGAASATAATARACAAGATVIADVPWPQQRYDLRALSQITDGAGVTVAVVDSGVDAAHLQLSKAVRPGKDILGRQGNGRFDCVGHGTAVASIIAAAPVAGVGLRGLAPGASILPIRASERLEINGAVSGEGTVADVAAGIRAAVAARVQVINVSISTPGDDPRLRRAVDAALAADVVVVAAVGNQHERGDPTPYPAAYPGVIGVGAIGQNNQRVPTSQVGSYVSIVAPGESVIAAVPGRGHAVYHGTSFAAPFVAATAALIRSHDRSLSRAEVVHRLLATADPAPGERPSPEYGYGVLNPMRALTEIVPPLDSITQPAPAATTTPPMRPTTAGDAGRGSPMSLAVGLAAVLAFVAAGVAAVAAAVPVGRRRRWRPGRLEAPPGSVDLGLVPVTRDQVTRTSPRSTQRAI